MKSLLCLTLFYRKSLTPQILSFLYFLGTFMKQKDWEPKVRKNQAREIEGALTSAQM